MKLMAELKLAKLPDRTPVKITVSVPPELNKALQTYASVYKETYGQAESVPDLIPFILEDYLRSDRRFSMALKGRPTAKARPSTN
jgi:hypothetical protein